MNEHALARTSRVLRSGVASWFFGRFTVYYISPSQSDGNSDLLEWLYRLGPDNRLLLKKIKLNMYASELLCLFASADVANTLNLPPRRPGLLKLRAWLTSLELNELIVDVLDLT